MEQGPEKGYRKGDQKRRIHFGGELEQRVRTERGFAVPQKEQGGQGNPGQPPQRKGDVAEAESEPTQQDEHRGNKHLMLCFLALCLRTVDELRFHLTPVYSLPNLDHPFDISFNKKGL